MSRATEIIVSTDSDKIIDYCKRQSIENLVVHKRPEGLCLDTTSTHQLIKLASQICTSSHVAWTHLTSPFFTSQLYADAIKCYFSQLSTGHDSLMAVYPIRGFIWNSTGPINYEASASNWPQTQSIEPFYKVTSGLFINSRDSYLLSSNRIGINPYLFHVNLLQSIDVDWPEDFANVELLTQSNPQLLGL